MDTPVIPLDQVSWQQAERDEFTALVTERQHHKSIEDNAKRQRADCDKRIEAMLLMTSDSARVQVDQFTVQRVTSRSASKLEPRKLLELGVSAGTIQQATVEGKPYSYVLVTGGGE